MGPTTVVAISGTSGSNDGVAGRRDQKSDATGAAISQSRRRGFLLPWARHRSIAQQVRDDFAAGRTVVVDGWVLSATEARQCALFSLASA